MYSHCRLLHDVSIESVAYTQLHQTLCLHICRIKKQTPDQPLDKSIETLDIFLSNPYLSHVWEAMCSEVPFDMERLQLESSHYDSTHDSSRFSFLGGTSAAFQREAVETRDTNGTNATEPSLPLQRVERGVADQPPPLTVQDNLRAEISKADLQQQNDSILPIDDGSCCSFGSSLSLDDENILEVDGSC